MCNIITLCNLPVFQPLAAQAGIRILEAGGNATDAAVAVAAALNVTQPSSTGMIFYSNLPNCKYEQKIQSEI